MPNPTFGPPDDLESDQAGARHESLYRALAQNLPYGAAFVVDRDLRYLLTAGEALATGGFAPEDLEGRTIHEALDPELASRYEAKFRRVFEGESFHWEHRAHGRDYESRGVPLRDDAGEIYAALVVSYDVTERKRDEAALERERELLRSLVEALPVMVAIYDAQLERVIVNRRVERVLGWRTEDFREIDLMEACYPDPTDRQRARRFMLSDEEGWRDFVVTAKDGSRVDTSWARIRLADDTLVGIGIDLTERKAVERALRDAKEAAEAASEAKTRFLSTISHELRTPLTAVLGLSDLMEAEVIGPVNEKQKRYLSRIQISARHLVGIIDEILTFSRSEAGKIDLRLSDVEIVDIAQAVVDMLATEAEVRGLEIRLHHDAELTAYTDAGKVRQILTNLVGNALKYTRDGGVDIELYGDAATFTIRVRDTGRGIDPARLDDIFEPFTQVDDTTTRDSGGTGLGLTICRRLARALGGDVTVQSTPEQGSTFTVQLPRYIS